MLAKLKHRTTDFRNTPHHSHFHTSHKPRPYNSRGRFHFSTQQALPDFDYRINYYEALGISDKATEPEIKKAFYALAKKYHPDANSHKASEKAAFKAGENFHEEKFKQISNAYDVLGDADKRK